MPQNADLSAKVTRKAAGSHLHGQTNLKGITKMSSYKLTNTKSERNKIEGGVLYLVATPIGNLSVNCSPENPLSINKSNNSAFDALFL